MNTKEFAELLDGRESLDELTGELERIATDNGLAVCFGYSDDLLEIRGAIDEEFGAWNGEKFELCRTDKGTIYWNEDTSIPVTEFGCKLREITAEWCPAEQGEIIASWKITSDIPHETFNIYEDGELYCIGIVFNVNDI